MTSFPLHRPAGLPADGIFSRRRKRDSYQKKCSFLGVLSHVVFYICQMAFCTSAFLCGVGSEHSDTDNIICDIFSKQIYNDFDSIQITIP